MHIQQIEAFGRLKRQQTIEKPSWKISHDECFFFFLFSQLTN